MILNCICRQQEWLADHDHHGTASKSHKYTCKHPFCMCRYGSEAE